MIQIYHIDLHRRSIVCKNSSLKITPCSLSPLQRVLGTAPGLSLHLPSTPEGKGHTERNTIMDIWFKIQKPTQSTEDNRCIGSCWSNKQNHSGKWRVGSWNGGSVRAWVLGWCGDKERERERERKRARATNLLVLIEALHCAVCHVFQSFPAWILLHIYTYTYS